MTEAAPPEAPSRPWVIVLYALVPWVAAVLPIVVRGVVGYSEWTTGELGGAALFCLAVVALPSLLSLAAARPGSMRKIVLVLLTLLAAGAGILIATSSDGQASLAVLLIPIVALPLALILWVARLFTRRSEAGPEASA